MSRAGSTPTTGFARPSRRLPSDDIPVLETPRGVDRLTDGAVHRDSPSRFPYTYVDATDLVDPEAPGIPLVVALDGVTDPRNLGAVIRSVAAFGGHGSCCPSVVRPA